VLSTHSRCTVSYRYKIEVSDCSDSRQHSICRYNIQLSCPSECIYCSAFWQVDLSNPYVTFIFAPYMLVLFGLVGVYLVLWIPCVWFKPNVAYDYERVREVPYQCGKCTTVSCRTAVEHSMQRRTLRTAVSTHSGIRRVRL
jgi:hypothetical protein